MASDDKKSPLTLVSPREPKSLELSLEDIENLDIEKLREIQLKGIYTLEAALFSQTVFESARLTKNQALISEIENLVPGLLHRLDPEDQLRLYEVVNKNRNSSLNFLLNLHSSIATALETLKNLEKEKINKGRDDEVKADANLEKIKALIHKQIKEKASKK